jgi:hypothetical protein
LGLTEANRVALAHVRAHAQREGPRHMAGIASVLAAAGVEADVETLVTAASGAGVVSLTADVDALVIHPAFAGSPPRSATASRPDAAEVELMRWQAFCATAAHAG